MKRRRFIHAAISSLTLPVVVKSQSVFALSNFTQEPAYAFFDERFKHAHRIAAAWAAENRLIAVQSDVTATWQSGLQHMAREHPLTLRGVTTESFQFCLRILLGEHTGLDGQVSRVDRNLLLWTMRTVPKFA
jgi:hypothetical protein